MYKISRQVCLIHRRQRLLMVVVLVPTLALLSAVSSSSPYSSGRAAHINTTLINVSPPPNAPQPISPPAPNAGLSGGGARATRGSHGHAPSRPVAISGGASSLPSSPVYAGYQSSVQGGTVTLTAKFMVPTLHCPSSGTLGTIPGVIVGGSSFLAAGIALQCSSGAPTYDPVVYFNGPFTYLNMTVHAGDTIVAKVVDSTNSIGSVSDTTTGVTRTHQFSRFSANYIAVGDDTEYMGYDQLGIPPFGTTTFANVTVNGAALGTRSPYRDNMGNGTTTLIQTSALNASGNGFTTTFIRSREPTNVQGRVIEGIAGQQTLAATVWPATFTSTASSATSSFAATIWWGDGSAASAGSIATEPAWNCTYSLIAPVGQCFGVIGRHRYVNPGAYVITVSVNGPGGPGDNSGIAEIIPTTSGSPVTDSVGVLTWTTVDQKTWGPVQMCTATALAGLDLIVTARHCFDNLDKNSNFEFAPMHSGTCGSGKAILSVAACETSGAGHDRYGYWSGTAVFSASESAPGDAGSDTVYIELDDTSSLGYSLLGTIGGLPLHFLAPHGQWTYSTYGYPGRNGNWSLQSCPNEQDQSKWWYVVLGIAPCALGGGTSGSPFISSNLLRNAIAGTLWFVCGPSCNGKDPKGLVQIWPPTPPQNTTIANYMSNNAMQAYVAAALAAYLI